MKVTIEMSAKLCDLLIEEQELVQALTSLLTQEKDCLSKNQIADINQLSEAKLKVLNCLESTDQNRLKILSAAGLPNSLDGLNQFIRNAPSTSQPVLTEKLTKLQTSLTTCRDANLVNGMILNNMDYNTSFLLRVLKGQDPESPSQVYGKSGKYTE